MRNSVSPSTGLYIPALHDLYLRLFCVVGDIFVCRPKMSLAINPQFRHNFAALARPLTLEGKVYGNFL